MIDAIRGRAQSIFISSSDRRPAFAAILEDLLPIVGGTCATLRESPLLPEDDGGSLLAVASYCALPIEHDRHSDAMVLAVTHGDERIGLLGIHVPARILARTTAEAPTELTPVVELIGQLLDVWRTARLRRHAQRSMARLSHIALQMQHGMCITNEEGVIDWANEAMAREHGCDQRDLIGRPLAALCRDYAGDAADAPSLLDRLDAGTPFEDEFRVIVTHTGEEHWLHVQARPFRSAHDSDESLVITWMDITERRRVERMKEDFVSTISHELRTPLTSIAGALALLDAQTASGLDPGSRELVRIALRNSNRLSRLVDDLLDLDKLAAGRLRIDLEVADAHALVAEARLDQLLYADAYGVALVIEPAASGDAALIEVDPARLQQVLRNLLSNAIKFSPAGGRVQVAVTVDDQLVRIDVRDAGCGIPWEVQPAIFQRFTQAPDVARGRSGTGLGLAISHELVLQMGGTLAFVSTPGHGSTFTISLPRLAIATTT